MKLDAFTLAYIVCALWASTDNSTPAGGQPLDDNYSVTDLAPEALERIKADCGQFQQANADLLAEAYSLYAVTDGSSPEEYAGHDLWLTRNGHGAGYWDQPITSDLPPQQRLSPPTAQDSTVQPYLLVSTSKENPHRSIRPHLPAGDANAAVYFAFRLSLLPLFRVLVDLADFAQIANPRLIPAKLRCKGVFGGWLEGGEGLQGALMAP